MKPYTKSGPIPKRPPRRQPPKESDWLCSKCGQVSNNSEPCYDCDCKEREANPIPPPPPAPDRPTRDTSKKSWPPPVPPQPPQGPYANASRKQPKAIYLDRLYTQDEIDEMEYNAIHRRVFRLALRFLDWLNRLTGVEKPKHKTNGEQMATFDELFESYEDIDRERGTEVPPPPPAPDRPTRDATKRY